MKFGKSGFTLVELLTTVAIIALLVGILVPSVNMVRNIAKEAKQNAQINTIEMALLTFKNDYGDYPPSDFPDLRFTPPKTDYCGAQKLSEALLGMDLRGFHPDSDFATYEKDPNPAGGVYYLQGFTPEAVEHNLKSRLGPYIERKIANTYQLGNTQPGSMDGLYGDYTVPPLRKDTFVICDIYGSIKLTLQSGKVVKAGRPILYYKANKSSKRFFNENADNLQIYNVNDNQPLIELHAMSTGIRPSEIPNYHPLCAPAFFYGDQYYQNLSRGIKSDNYLVDIQASQMSQGVRLPYRPDSYILISAGPDGLYGTADDITNFGHR
jgi:prepilin-type N-terminal cleavage/methylation domain-containing protein